MWINYNDSEIRTFHPICEEALNKALSELGLNNKYQVVHHEMFGTIEADFVIKNKINNKYLCIIEVKRTLSDIQSTRYQYQAMSYVQSAGNRMELPFYLITNLEYSYVFRYDQSKPNNFQQMLEPGLVKCSLFSELDKVNFISRLKDIFVNYITMFVNNEYNYIITLDNVKEYIEDSKSNIILWRTNLAILLYEYIRGAFEAVGRKDFKNINLFLNDVISICEEASEVDFSPIFSYNENQLNKRYSIERTILEKIHDFGKQNISGELIANMIHQIISSGREELGEVATDIELSYLVSILAKCYHKQRNIRRICDPAAGSGSLIGSAIKIFDLNPGQIVANDINEQLLQVLSIRLGLLYVDTINATNTVHITSNDVADMRKEDFSDVDIVLMNPPYIAGVRPGCREKKEKFSRKIYQLTNSDSLTNVGQIGLECVFTELVSNLVNNDTTIACVLPKQYLFSLGSDAILFRKYLISEFGLKAIFFYPGNTVFENVVKDTVILIGNRDQESDVISVISSLIPIQDLDSNLFETIIKDNINSIEVNSYEGTLNQHNLNISNFPKDYFIRNIEDSWNFVNLEGIENSNYLKELTDTNKLVALENSNYYDKMYRGKAGNSGGSDLIFSSAKDGSALYCSAMRNAELDCAFIVEGDSYFNYDEHNIPLYIDTYLKDFTAHNGGQNREEKSRDDLIKIYIDSLNAVVNENSILIPRNLRKLGRVYCTTNKCLVSTNFVVLENLNEKELVALTSWMKTIFYQTVCEIYAKPQEGTRKMEKKEIAKTLIPIDLSLTDDEYEYLRNELLTEQFVELDNPILSNIDIFWANKIFGINEENMLTLTKRLLRLLSSIRQRRI